MEQPASVFSFLLVLIAIGLAWMAGYRSRFHRFHHIPGLKRSPQQDYFVGLNYLLNDEPDDAIDIFIEALEVNSDTLATKAGAAMIINVMAVPGNGQFNPEGAPEGPAAVPTLTIRRAR